MCTCWPGGRVELRTLRFRPRLHGCKAVSTDQENFEAWIVPAPARVAGNKSQRVEWEREMKTLHYRWDMAVVGYLPSALLIHRGRTSAVCSSLLICVFRRYPAEERHAGWEEHSRAVRSEPLTRTKNSELESQLLFPTYVALRKWRTCQSFSYQIGCCKDYVKSGYY